MDFATIMSSSFIRVKAVTFVHFCLTVNAMMGSYLPTAYIYYNVLFMVALFWALHSKESIDAIHTAALIDACSIIFDLICIIAFFSSYHNGWSIVFSIVNLIARPFSLLLLHRELVERGGSLSNGTIFPSSAPRSYEDIDHPNQSVPTNNTQPQTVAAIF